MTPRIDLPREALEALCRRFGVRELALFGSALGEDFTADSDVDFLVVFENNDYGPWMGKLTELEAELSALLGRKADVVPKDWLKWVIRDAVLAEAQVLYEAA